MLVLAENLCASLASNLFSSPWMWLSGDSTQVWFSFSVFCSDAAFPLPLLFLFFVVLFSFLLFFSHWRSTLLHLENMYLIVSVFLVALQLLPSLLVRSVFTAEGQRGMCKFLVVLKPWSIQVLLNLLLTFPPRALLLMLGTHHCFRWSDIEVIFPEAVTCLL